MANYFRTIEKLSDTIYVCNAEGYIILYNKAAAKLWGWAPMFGNEKYWASAKISKPDGSCLDKDDSPVALLLSENKTVEGVEIILHRRDGDIRNVIQYSALLYSFDGCLAGALTRLIDITEKKQRELVAIRA